MVQVVCHILELLGSCKNINDGKCLKHLTDLPTEIITFSDDMDGLRKVPDNVPQKELLEKNLHKPLTQVPDPFQ